MQTAVLMLATSGTGLVRAMSRLCRRQACPMITNIVHNQPVLMAPAGYGSQMTLTGPLRQCWSGALRHSWGTIALMLLWQAKHGSNLSGVVRTEARTDKSQAQHGALLKSKARWLASNCARDVTRNDPCRTDRGPISRERRCLVCTVAHHCQGASVLGGKVLSLHQLAATQQHLGTLCPEDW